MSEETKAFHWHVAGYVSPGAQEWILEKGGQVLPLHREPPLVAVALAYDPGDAWTWSKGRQEYRQGIAYWSTGELQEASTGITLQYRSSSDQWTLAEYCSAETTSIILPDEEYDPKTHQVKAPGMYHQPLETANYDDTALGDIDEHPF